MAWDGNEARSRREWFVAAGRWAVPIAAGAGAALLPRGSLRRGDPRRTTLWVADRARDAVFGLDADGLVRSRYSVRAPVGLQAVGPSCLAVVSRLQDRQSFERVILEAGRRLTSEPWHALPRTRAPALGDDVRQVCIDTDGTRLWLLRHQCGARSKAGTGARIDLRPSRATSQLERWVCRNGAWRRAFRFELAWPARSLARGAFRWAARDRAGVWVAAERVGALRFYTDTGRMLCNREVAGIDGTEVLEPAAAESGGGVWLGCGGAVVRLDSRGRRMPGQGGFGFVSALLSEHRRANAPR